MFDPVMFVEPVLPVAIHILLNVFPLPPIVFVLVLESVNLIVEVFALTVKLPPEKSTTFPKPEDPVKVITLAPNVRTLVLEPNVKSALAVTACPLVSSVPAVN